jgi:hypothetical protein
MFTPSTRVATIGFLSGMIGVPAVLRKVNFTINGRSPPTNWQ